MEELVNSPGISKAEPEQNNCDQFLEVAMEVRDEDIYLPVKDTICFKCTICSEEYATNDKLSFHYVMDHSYKMCEICADVFVTLDDVLHHEQVVHYPLHCEMCKTVCHSLETLNKHRIDIHSMYQCSLCAYEFYSDQSLALHIRQKHFVVTEQYDLCDNLISGWDDKKWLYLCKMCTKVREKSEVYGHFRGFHRLSLVAFTKKLIAQNLILHITGARCENGNTSDTIYTLATCKVCFEQVSDIMPRAVHSLICLGHYICKFCFRSFPNEVLRNVHVVEKHSNFKCTMGCEDNDQFTQEDNLNDHYINVHCSAPCLLCQSVLSLSGLSVHFKDDHLCLKPLDSSTNNKLVRVSQRESEPVIVCDLCDIDLTVNGKSVVDVFSHLRYHSVSLESIVQLIEGNPILTIVTPKIGSKYKKDLSAKSNDLSETECKTASKSVPNSNGTKQDTLADVDCRDNLSDNCNTLEKISDADDGKGKNDKAETDNKNTCKATSSVKESSGDSNNLAVDENVENTADTVKSVEDSGKNIDGSDGVNSDSSQEKINKIVDGDETVISEPEKHSTEDSECETGEESDEHEENENKMEEVRNVVAEVNPCKLECILTDTSDIESDTETNQEENSEPDTAENSVTEGANEIKKKNLNVCLNDGKKTRRKSMQLQSISDSKERNIPHGETVAHNNAGLLIEAKLPGLNKLDVKENGFVCEICQGQFNPTEGVKELLKHLKILHGLKNNSYAIWPENDTNKKKTDPVPPPYSFQPAHECPCCNILSESKRLLRAHALRCHGANVKSEASSEGLCYKCRFCSSLFWNASKRNVHEINDHPIENPVRCHLCSEAFVRKICLNQHIRRQHSGELNHSFVSYKCNQCSLLYPVFHLLEEHFKTQHPLSVVFRCPHCDMPLKTKKILKRHIKSQHEVDQNQQCPICGKMLHSKRAIALHIRFKHHNDNKLGFKCRICQQRFNNKEQRMLHYKNEHLGESPFQCIECGKGFASKSGLYGHRQVHSTNTNSFKCKYCNKEFSRRDSYNEHLLIHEGPRHRCPYCNKEFVQRSNMVRHIRIHTGEKPYKCIHCDKMFSDKGACNSHMRVHTREEESSCPYCGKVYSKKQKLKYHIRLHTGEGLVGCEICNKTFTNSYMLKEHRAIHDQQTQILCAECGKGFSSTKYMLRHVELIHKPSRSFACVLCSKVFSQQTRLRQHLMTHGNVKHVQCLLCERGYNSRRSVRNHLLKKHGIARDDPQNEQCYTYLSAEQTGILEAIGNNDKEYFSKLLSGQPVGDISIQKLQRKQKSSDDEWKQGDTDKNESKQDDQKNASEEDPLDDSIGKRLTRKHRKSRPKCLKEIHLEYSSDEFEYLVPTNSSKYDMSGTGAGVAVDSKESKKKDSKPEAGVSEIEECEIKEISSGTVKRSTKKSNVGSKKKVKI